MTERTGTVTFPNYSHRSLANIMKYAPLTLYAKYLNILVIGIVGSNADSAILTKNFIDAALEPKAYVEVEGATHVSLYDIDEDVKRAVDAMDTFFKKHTEWK